MSGPAWQQFWKKVYRYIVENSLPAFDVLFYVLSVPSVIHLSSREVIRELERVIREARLPSEPVTESHILPAMTVVGEALRRYSKQKKFPNLFSPSLSFLYNLIMQDFLKSNREYSLEEAIQTQENLASTKIQARTWFVINAILNNSHVSEVRELIEKTREEEKPASLGENNLPISFVISSYMRGDKDMVEWVEEQINTYWKRGKDYDTIVSFLGGKREGEQIVFPLTLSKFFFALLISFFHWQQKLHDLRKECLLEKGRLQEKIKELKEEIKKLREEKEELKQALSEASQPIRETVYINAEKALKERHERELSRLKESYSDEISFWKGLVEKMVQAQEEEPEKELAPLPEKVRIAYYGRLSERLRGLFLKYNIEAEEYSPTSPTAEVPDSVIVFNVSEAAHKVRFKLGERSVILVRGSNAERIVRRVVEKLSGFLG